MQTNATSNDSEYAEYLDVKPSYESSLSMLEEAVQSRLEENNVNG